MRKLVFASQRERKTNMRRQHRFLRFDERSFPICTMYKVVAIHLLSHQTPQVFMFIFIYLYIYIILIFNRIPEFFNNVICGLRWRSVDLFRFLASAKTSCLSKFNVEERTFSIERSHHFGPEDSLAEGITSNNYVASLERSNSSNVYRSIPVDLPPLNYDTNENTDTMFFLTMNNCMKGKSQILLRFAAKLELDKIYP